jgi:hypothetical protein
MRLNANILKTNSSGFSFGKKDDLALNPFSELIFSVAACWLRCQTCHPINAGIMRNNQKKPGFKKVMFVIIGLLF